MVHNGNHALPEHAAGIEMCKPKPRVLIMDDEKQVRTTLTLMLGFFGLEVTAATEGSEAVDLYRQALEEGRSFHCVLLDLSVPTGMNGLETLARLRRLDPDVRAILCSGSLCGQHGLYRDLGFREVVPKPFTSEGLRRSIESVLGS